MESILLYRVNLLIRLDEDNLILHLPINCVIEVNLNKIIEISSKGGLRRRLYAPLERQARVK